MSKLALASDSNGTTSYVTTAQTFIQKIAASLGFGTVVNSAVSGQYAAGVLANINSQVLTHSPDAAIVMIGTNDMANAHDNNVPNATFLPAYLATMSSIVDAVKSAGIRLTIFSPPMSRISEVNARMSELVEQLRELCLAKGVAFFDVFGLMMRDARRMTAAQFNGASQENPNGYWYNPDSSDKWHLSATGHERVAAGYCCTQIGAAAAAATATGVVLDETLSTTFGNITGSTVKVQILVAGSALDVPDGPVTKIRFTFKGHADEPLQVGAIYVGQKATGGNEYDAASLVPVTYSGVNAFTVPQGGTLVSDWITFAWNKTSDLIVSLYGNGGSSNDKLAAVATSAADAVTHLASGNSAAVADASGFTPYNYLSLVAKIETDGF